MQRFRQILFVIAVGAVVAGCGNGSNDHERGQTASSRVDLAAEVRRDLAALHQSTIREVPRLVALFYHHSDGWAVEDTSLDEGTTWCRHAWYRWELVDVVARDQFTVRYTPTTENPACAPLGRPLVLEVTDRSTHEGRTVLRGEYVGAGLHAERTVCPGTIRDWERVCDHSSGLGAPTEHPPPSEAIGR